MKIITTGGRKYTDFFTVYYALKGLPPDTEIIHGAATGADEIVAQVAKGFGYVVHAVPAEWDVHGKAAGPIRNRKMLTAYGPADILYAFPGGSGTEDMITAAMHAGVPVHRFG